MPCKGKSDRCVRGKCQLEGGKLVGCNTERSELDRSGLFWSQFDLYRSLLLLLGWRQVRSRMPCEGKSDRCVRGKCQLEGGKLVGCNTERSDLDRSGLFWSQFDLYRSLLL